MDNTQLPKKWYQSTGGAIFLGILIFLLVVALLFLILVGYFLYNMKYGNGNTAFKSQETKTDQQEIGLDPNSLIYEHNPVLGRPDAPVTIIAFEDFACPYCRESFPILKAIEKKYGSAIRLIFKHSPIASLHPDALLAHIASECANNQGKFWDYYDLLYGSQELDKESLLGYAESLSINNLEFQQCLDSAAPLNIIETDLEDGGKIGLRGTPTFLVNGKLYEGTLSEEQWSNLILQELKQN